MEKIKNLPNWKRYFLKNERKRIKRLRTKKRNKRRHLRRKNFKQDESSDIVYTQKIHGAYEISAPDVFSLIDNTEETLHFFREVYDCIVNRRRIKLKLKDINKITTDAILYMLSYIEYNRIRGRQAQISGDFPEDPACSKIFETSGFFNYLYYSGTLRSDPDTFAIRSNSLVSPDVAKAVKDFARERLILMRSDPRRLYTNLIECMANTRNHAYPDSLYAKWWLMASFNKEDRKIHFTFLDNGLGIPRTIRKSLGEYIKHLLAGLEHDAILIHSALKGEFRTQTGQKYRGKGLPVIYQTARENKIENLIIISRKGYVNATEDRVNELDRTFYGTLLSWDFV